MKKRIACLMLALVLIIGLIPVAAVTASAAATGVSEAGVRVIKDFVGFHRNAYEISGSEESSGDTFACSFFRDSRQT